MSESTSTKRGSCSRPKPEPRTSSRRSSRSDSIRVSSSTASNGIGSSEILTPGTWMPTRSSANSGVRFATFSERLTAAPDACWDRCSITRRSRGPRTGAVAAARDDDAHPGSMLGDEDRYPRLKAPVALRKEPLASWGSVKRPRDRRSRWFRKRSGWAPITARTGPPAYRAARRLRPWRSPWSAPVGRRCRCPRRRGSPSCAR